MKRMVTLAAAALAAGLAFADAPRVVVTTGWVAAFVRTAGYSGPIRVLAPLELAHPPEYELKPSDVTAVAGADLVVYAGYEVMVTRLRDAAGGGKAKVLQIATDHSLKTIQESVRAIAVALGTSAAAAENLRAVEAFYESWRKELAAAGLAGAPVLVHALQKPLLDELGFRIAGVFGPAPLEAARIRDLSGAGASLVADNVHNPVGEPLRETVKDVRYVALVNFPSTEVGVLDILAMDRKLLAAAWIGTAR
jgi:zinc transport system substrate-binding protein